MTIVPWINASTCESWLERDHKFVYDDFITTNTEFRVNTQGNKICTVHPTQCRLDIFSELIEQPSNQSPVLSDIDIDDDDDDDDDPMTSAEIDIGDCAHEKLIFDKLTNGLWDTKSNSTRGVCTNELILSRYAAPRSILNNPLDLALASITPYNGRLVWLCHIFKYMQIGTGEHFYPMVLKLYTWLQNISPVRETDFADEEYFDKELPLTSQHPLYTLLYKVLLYIDIGKVSKAICDNNHPPSITLYDKVSGEVIDDWTKTSPDKFIIEGILAMATTCIEHLYVTKGRRVIFSQVILSPTVSSVIILPLIKGWPSSSSSYDKPLPMIEIVYTKSGAQILSPPQHARAHNQILLFIQRPLVGHSMDVDFNKNWTWNSAWIDFAETPECKEKDDTMIEKIIATAKSGYRHNSRLQYPAGLDVLEYQLCNGSNTIKTTYITKYKVVTICYDGTISSPVELLCRTMYYELTAQCCHPNDFIIDPPTGILLELDSQNIENIKWDEGCAYPLHSYTGVAIRNDIVHLDKCVYVGILNSICQWQKHTILMTLIKLACVYFCTSTEVKTIWMNYMRYKLTGEKLQLLIDGYNHIGGCLQGNLALILHKGKSMRGALVPGSLPTRVTIPTIDNDGYDHTIYLDTLCYNRVIRVKEEDVICEYGLTFGKRKVHDDEIDIEPIIQKTLRMSSFGINLHTLTVSPYDREIHSDPKTYIYLQSARECGLIFVAFENDLIDSNIIVINDDTTKIEHYTTRGVFKNISTRNGTKGAITNFSKTISQLLVTDAQVFTQYIIARRLSKLADIKYMKHLIAAADIFFETQQEG